MLKVELRQTDETGEEGSLSKKPDKASPKLGYEDRQHFVFRGSVDGFCRWGEEEGEAVEEANIFSEWVSDYVGLEQHGDAVKIPDVWNDDDGEYVVFWPGPRFGGMDGFFILRKRHRDVLCRLLFV